MILRRWMRRVEEAMIVRLLRQRDEAWAEADGATRALKTAKPPDPA